MVVTLYSLESVNVPVKVSLKFKRTLRITLCVFCCLGNDLYHEMIESGVISLKDKTSKVALVYGQMNEPPGARARVALTGLTVAEYFRDQEGQDVLLFIDNIFRYVCY